MKIVGFCRLLLAIAGLGIGIGFQLATGQSSTVSSEPVEMQKMSESALKVYWVGHSLMEGSADSSLGRNSVLDLVKLFAESNGLIYSMGDHTLWGAPLSLQWGGLAHSNKRSVPERKTLREKFELNAGVYNALVVTDTVPIGNAIKYDFSSYYLRKFYCAFTRKNPTGRVYLYESWRGIQYVSGSSKVIKTQTKWQQEMSQDRKLWNKLADDAKSGNVVEPGLVSRVMSTIGIRLSDPCPSQQEITIIPAGSALVGLNRMLNEDQSVYPFLKPDGNKLQLLDLFSNPYKFWPYDDSDNVDAGTKSEIDLKLVDSTRGWDEIHASNIGIYFAALVTYAALTAKKPLDLPFPDEVGRALSRDLQEIAWQMVQSDDRSGIQ